VYLFSRNPFSHNPFSHNPGEPMAAEVLALFLFDLQRFLAKIISPLHSVLRTGQCIYVLTLRQADFRYTLHILLMKRREPEQVKVKE
jgi:hypothetical protein